MSWIKVTEVTGVELAKRTRNVREMLDLFEKKLKNKIKKTDTWHWAHRDYEDIIDLYKWVQDE
jgi:hypothetical protein